ncbi:MAG: hypothetical protein D6711_09230 [Chloroflexi bacterium]|nr:MAG: hypothetical protein D6711_09230 [Chloroflexota bacterium]
MNIIGDLKRAIDTFYYNIVLSLAELHWSLLRGLVLMGHTIETINQWLIERAFAPLITQTNASLSVAISFAFVIALLVLGLTYMLAALVRLEVVNFRSAVTWYIAGALFFALGPSLYIGMNDFRMSIAQGFYVSTLQGLQDNMGTTFGSLDQVQSTDLALGPLCDYLGPYLPGATGAGTIDGLDVALAYLRADGPDVMGFAYPVYSPGCPVHLLHPLSGNYVSGVPQEWFFDGSYFDVNVSPYYFDDLSDGERASAISMGTASHARMLTAWPLVIFGVVEQMVYLLITIAMGITFLSFSMAILFAFFKKTEVIAKSIIDQWIELIVQTVVIAMVQSLVVAFFLAGTAAGNGMVVLGVGLICLIFMLIVLWSGVKAVWNSLNRLFNAMGQATGGVMIAPGTAATAAAGAGAMAAGAAVGIGSGALAGMTALRSGATMAQAAGVSMGGSRTLSGAARTLAYLPGVRNTSLGDAAEQFTEGSVTRQVAGNIPLVGRAAGPIVGAKLLTDRDPDNAEYDEQGRMVGRPMLVPAVGEGLENWTVPRGARRRRVGTFTPVAPVPTRDTEDNLQEERRQQRSDYASEMQGEEMEQHLLDVMRANTGVTSPLGAMMEETHEGDSNQLGQVASRLEAGADLLARAAQMQMMVGQLRVAGVPDVAGVMADVVSQVQTERGTPPNSQKQAEAFTATTPPTQPAGIDALEVGRRMAQVMGVTPQAETGSPVQCDLARFGLFVDQALQMGLSPQQTEQVVREVQSSPEGKLRPETREALDKQVQTGQNVTWIKARDQVDKLEHSARMLPPEITAYGAMPVPVNTPDTPGSSPAGTPSVTVKPDVRVDPTVRVNVQPPAVKNDEYDAVMKKQSSLGGRGSVIGGDNG